MLRAWLDGSSRSKALSSQGPRAFSFALAAEKPRALPQASSVAAFLRATANVGVATFPIRCSSLISRFEAVCAALKVVSRRLVLANQTQDAS
jgi:hypothetical protein